MTQFERICFDLFANCLTEEEANATYLVLAWAHLEGYITDADMQIVNWEYMR